MFVCKQMLAFGRPHNYYSAIGHDDFGSHGLE